MNTRTGIIFPIIVVLAVMASGCIAPSGGGPDNIAPGTGKLVLQITDQPKLDIASAMVTVSKVEVHVSGAGDDSGWTTVEDREKTFDLVAIKDVSEYLGEKDLASGKYTQVRLAISKATVTVEGATYDLAIPSGDIKIVKGFTVEANKTTTLTLDFDADSSITRQGNGNYSMTPVVKVLATQPEVKNDEKNCIGSGGILTTGWCCKSVSNFPNMCGVGSCGCSLDNSHEVRLCNCGEGKCFDGSRCV
jgi:hypothetical protein